MQENISAINRIWKPEYAGPGHNAGCLAFFRISVGLLAMIHLVIFFNYSPLLYGEHGIIKPEINRAIRQVFGNYFINIDVHSVTAVIIKYTSLSEPASIYVLLGVYFFILLLFIAGLFTPLTALVSWLLNMVLLNSYQLSCYGYDMFMSNCLLLSAFMPVNATISLDRYWFAIKENRFLTRYSISILRLFLCFIYFFSGINKMASAQWWTGESVWRAMMQPPFLSFDAGFLSRYPLLLTAGSVLTLGIETLYPVLIHIQKTKKAMVLLAILMHLGIAVFLGLWFFSGIMIIMNLTVYFARPLELNAVQRRRTSNRMATNHTKYPNTLSSLFNSV